MKKIKLLLFCFIPLSFFGQGPVLQWAKKIGGNSNDYGQSIATDPLGNVYVTGRFGGTIDFDPGPSIYNLNALGQSDIFVSKFSANGQFLWAVSFGDPEDDDNSYSSRGNGIITDTVGNVYITGEFEGTVDFDPSPGTSYLSASYDDDNVYILKLDTNGSFIWARNFYGNGTGIGNAIAVDESGSVYTTGYFSNKVDFDPSPNEYELSSSGGYDIFISKLNSEGEFVWAKSIGGATHDRGNSIDLDSSNNVYITGYFTDSVDFDPGPEVYELTPHSYFYDIFIHKMNQQSCIINPAITSVNPAFGTCLGDSIVLNAEMPCWVTDFSYSWNTGETSDSIILTPDSTSTYSVDVNYMVDTAVCNTSTSVEVTVFNNAVEVPYNGFDDDCDELTLDDDIDQDGINLALDCDDNNPVVPGPPGSPCDDGDANTINDILLYDSCTCVGNNYIPGPELEWVNQIEGEDGSSGRELTTDQWGNVYVVGLYEDTIDVDPGPDEYILTTVASPKIFIAKYNPNSQLIWAVSIGGDTTHVYGLFTSASGIATDLEGSVYITGAVRGIVDFDPGPGTFNLSGYGIFILKLDTHGNFVWAKKMSGTNYYNRGTAIIIDDVGNVYTTGRFEGTVDFDPDSGVFNLTSAGFEYYNDIFISKLNIDGEFVWAKRRGGGGWETSTSIALDNANNVYLTGASGWFDNDGGEDGKATLFVSKRDKDGELIWLKQAGQWTTTSFGIDIEVDEVGNGYITGYFDQTVDFDPGLGVYNLTATESSNTNFERDDIFILKLNTDGEFVWAKAIGGGENDEGRGIALDENSNVYVLGYFEEITDFDPGLGIHNLSSIGDEDIYILKLDNNGFFSWAGSFVGYLNGYDSGTSIALDNWDNIYTTGYFQETLDFDPSEEVFELTANETGVAFIHKMRQQPCNTGPFIHSDATPFITCPGDSIALTAELPSWVTGVSYSWNTGETSDSIVVVPDSTTTYTVSVNYTVDTTVCNSFTSVEVVVNFIDFLLTEDLELCEQDVATLEVSGGASYLWSTGDSTNIITITAGESQAYFVTVSDVNGCIGMDSVNVLVNQESAATYLQNTSCDSLELGSLLFVYPDQNGCDSLIVETTTLLITPEMPTAPADMLIHANDPPFQITIEEIPNATEYFWVVPPGVQILSGANTNSITVDWGGMTTGGSICVIAINKCGTSPSACIEVAIDISDGLNDIAKKGYSIFPNPTAAIINIVFEDIQPFEIKMLDVLGRVVVPPAKYVTHAQIDVSLLPAGIYWLKISSEGAVDWEQIEILR